MIPNKLAELLKKARKYVEQDALMVADMRRHRPLAPEEQAELEAEQPSEKLMDDIDAALFNHEAHPVIEVAWCGHCKAIFMRCPACGNNGCNGGYGTTEDGEECAVCETMNDLENAFHDEATMKGLADLANTILLGERQKRAERGGYPVGASRERCITCKEQFTSTGHTWLCPTCEEKTDVSHKA